jgi:riboflavin kinase/FMN adenylyltransferase
VELLRRVSSLSSKACVVTIGNFDGGHVGHQALISRCITLAKERKLVSVVVSFEPQPLEFFAPHKAPVRLTYWREKFDYFQSLGVERWVALPFDSTMASMHRDAFVNDLLYDKLGMRALMVGDDFRFGKDRHGGYEDLQRASVVRGFYLERAQTCFYQGRRISSRWVRDCLKDGDFALAEKLLDRPYTMQGRVIRGQQLGTKLGYPTINIPLNRLHSPLHGVYVVEVLGLGTSAVLGVASVGTRPVVDGKDVLLEVHLFDFDDDVYGRRVKVRFYRHLRKEQDFASLDALKRQIAKDCTQARLFFEQKQIKSMH